MSTSSSSQDICERDRFCFSSLHICSESRNGRGFDIIAILAHGDRILLSRWELVLTEHGRRAPAQRELVADGGGARASVGCGIAFAEVQQCSNRAGIGCCNKKFALISRIALQTTVSTCQMKRDSPTCCEETAQAIPLIIFGFLL